MQVGTVIIRCMKSVQFLEHILYDIFGENEPTTSRAMMGAHILYYEGKTFAIVEDDGLWFKGSKDTEEWYLSRGSKKFWYMKADKDGKKKKQHMGYFYVPQEVYEDKEKREEWFEVALSVAVLPKKKRVKNKR